MLETSIMIIVIATMAEAVWENIKSIFPDSLDSGIWKYVNKIGSLLTGVGLALLTGVNIFPLLNIPLKIDVIGVILTGVLLGRGANYIHDLINLLKRE